MDPATFIATLAAHLFFSGGLLFLIARRLPAGGGIGHCAAGMMLFGATYMLRLLMGLMTQSPWAILADMGIIVAVLLLNAGMRHFGGWPPLRLRTWLTLALLALGLEFLAYALAGQVGRHLVVNTAVGLLYATLAWGAANARKQVAPAMRGPLLAMSLMLIPLSALTFARGLTIASQGIGASYGGSFASIYFAYGSLAAVLLAMCLLWLVFEQLTGQLADLATRDALTRVLNRAGLDDALQRHFGNRSAAPLTLLAIDVDHFKRINDSHGHATGDAVLLAVAGALARHVRPNDLVARVGGEEFMVCCPACADGCAAPLAERLREAVAALDTEGVHCTVSIGISRPCAALADWAGAATEADQALYAAKAAGRNRVLSA